MSARLSRWNVTQTWPLMYSATIWQFFKYLDICQLSKYNISQLKCYISKLVWVVIFITVGTQVKTQNAVKSNEQNELQTRSSSSYSAPLALAAVWLVDTFDTLGYPQAPTTIDGETVKVVRHSVTKDGSIAHIKEDAEAPPEVTERLAFILLVYFYPLYTYRPTEPMDVNTYSSLWPSVTQYWTFDLWKVGRSFAKFSYIVSGVGTP